MPEFSLELTNVRLTTVAFAMLDSVLSDGSLAIDATVGNGYDTLFLSHRVGPQGHVVGFDVQKMALTGAGELLRFAGVFSRVRLILDDHANLGRYLAQDQNLNAAMFNLGYLPRGNRQVITRPETTVIALQEVLARLSSGGMITILSYRGHPGGEEEYAAVAAFLRRLPEIFSVREITGETSRLDAPRLFIVQRVRIASGDQR